MALHYIDGSSVSNGQWCRHSPNGREGDSFDSITIFARVNAREIPVNEFPYILAIQGPGIGGSAARAVVSVRRTSTALTLRFLAIKLSSTGWAESTSIPVSVGADEWFNAAWKYTRQIGSLNTGLGLKYFVNGQQISNAVNQIKSAPAEPGGSTWETGIFKSSFFRGGAIIADRAVWTTPLSDADCKALTSDRLDPLNITDSLISFVSFRNGDTKDQISQARIIDQSVLGKGTIVADPFGFIKRNPAKFITGILDPGVTPVVPDAPTNPAAVAGDEKVTVTWTDAPTATSHNLYWSLSSPVTTGDNKISTVTTPYTHTGRTNGVEYFYAIVGENASGEGDLSTEVSATPVAAQVYAPGVVLSDPQVIGSWRIDQMSLDKLNTGLTLRENRGIQSIEVPAGVFSLSTFPNLDTEIIGETIPNAIGVGLRGLPAFLIDSTTKRFKVLNNPLTSWDGFRDSDGNGFIPDVLDLSTAEFTFAGWDGSTELFADVSCLGENPVDAKFLLLTDNLRGANLPSTSLDTTSTGKGFGANGARVKYIRGTSSKTGDEKVKFSISLYMDKPKKVEDWIQDVDAASFGITYTDQAGVWQCKAWQPIVSDDMMHLDELFLKDPKFNWKMSDPVTRVVANYAKDHRTVSSQSYDFSRDELRQARGLTLAATATRDLPLSDEFSAQYWAQRTVAMRGVPRKILTCTAPQEFSLLELGDFLRVTYAPLDIDGPYEVFKSTQRADSMEVILTLIDVRGFGDTVGFWMADSSPVWDNSRTDAEIKNDRENGAWYTDSGGYADTDDPKRSYEEAVYI